MGCRANHYERWHIVLSSASEVPPKVTSGYLIAEILIVFECHCHKVYEEKFIKVY